MLRRTIALATAAALLLLGAERFDGRLGWLVCAPLAFATDEPMPMRRSILLGVLFTSMFAVLRHVGWLAEAAQAYFELSPIAAWAASFVLSAACALPLGALLGLLLGCTSRLARTARVGAVALVWTAWESLARATFPSYPWVGLAATQVDQIHVLQLASLGGQAGLSLALGLGGSALGSALGAALRTTEPRERFPRAAAGAGALIGLVVVASSWGAWQLRAAPPTPALCSLAAVDARLTRPESSAETLARYDAPSARAAVSRPDAIVWPESALPANPLLDAELLSELRRRSAEWGAVLLAGGSRFEWSADWRPRLFNSIFRIGPSGAVEVYDKQEPVPFAEAWPTALLPRPGWLEDDDVAPGRPIEPMLIGGCRVGVLICFEAERPRLARDLAVRGADVIVVASNDAQLPEAAIATEVAEARLRAVETGLPVLRAANSGPSLAIDRYGRVSDGPGASIVRIEAGEARLAPAVRWAGALVASCWIGVALVVVTAFRRRDPR